MPKCSCAGSSCSCAIQVGDGLNLQGTGNAGSPFVISLASSLVTVNQTATGPLDLSQVKAGSAVLVNLSASVTSLILPSSVGARIDLIFTQVTAPNPITWGSAIKWPGGTLPVLSTTINYTDWFAIRAISATTWIGSTLGLAIR